MSIFLTNLKAYLLSFLARVRAGALPLAQRLLDWALTITFLRLVWNVVLLSARNPSVLVVYGVLAIGGYAWGHLEAADDWQDAMAVQSKAQSVKLEQCQAAKKEAEAKAAAAAQPATSVTVPMPPPKRVQPRKAAPKGLFG